jgi:uncharacterized protein (AIM24 family)
MASIISAGTTSGTAIAVSGDTTGILTFQTNGTTNALTISTGQQIQVNTGGSVSAPVISKSDDTNTGIFFSAADTIDFAEGGTACGQFDSSGNFKFNSGYGSVVTAFGCRAWVNFNGTGTVAIRASGNVSSITDVNTGTYRINFATAMPDTNYCVVAGCVYVAGSGTLRTLQRLSDQPETTSNVTVIAYEESGGAVDPTICDVAIFR